MFGILLGIFENVALIKGDNQKSRQIFGIINY